MIVQTDGYHFQFPDALDAFVFDEKEPSSPHFHGLPMKAVDILVEFNDRYLFIEIKEMSDTEQYDVKANGLTEETLRARRDGLKWLKNYLKYKYRDTFLARYAEDKVDKPIVYFCLINFDNALNNYLGKELKRELPTGILRRRQRQIAEDCFVVNLERWNINFPKWPAQKVS